MVLINSGITLSKEICSGNEFSRVLFPDNYYRDFYRPTTTVEDFTVQQRLPTDLSFNQSCFFPLGTLIHSNLC